MLFVKLLSHDQHQNLPRKGHQKQDCFISTPSCSLSTLWHNFSGSLLLSIAMLSLPVISYRPSYGGFPPFQWMFLSFILYILWEIKKIINFRQATKTEQLLSAWSHLFLSSLSGVSLPKIQLDHTTRNIEQRPHFPSFRWADRPQRVWDGGGGKGENLTAEMQPD